MIDKYTQQTPALKTVFNDTTMLTVDEKAEVKNLAVSGEAVFDNPITVNGASDLIKTQNSDCVLKYDNSDNAFKIYTFKNMPIPALSISYDSMDTGSVNAKSVDTRHFYSSFDAQFNGTATFDGETTLNDITNFNGVTNFNNQKAVFNGEAHFHDNANFYGNLSIKVPNLPIDISSGHMSIENSFTFSSETHIDDPANVTFNLPTTFTYDAYLAKMVNIGEGLNVDGESMFHTAFVAGPLFIGGEPSFNEAKVSVSDTSGFNCRTDAHFYKNTVFEKDTKFEYPVEFANFVYMNFGASVTTLYAKGPVVIGPNEAITLDEESTIIDSPIYFNKNININGTVYAAGPVYFDGDVDFNGISIRMNTMYALGPVVIGNEKITLDEESTIIDSPVYFNNDLYIGDVNVAREYGPVNLNDGYFNTAAGFTYAITVPPTASESCVITDNATQTTLATIKPNSQGVIVAMSPRTNYTGTCNVVEVFKLAAPLTFTGNTSGTSGDSSLLELIKTENLIFRGTDNDVTFGYHLPDASHLFSTNSYRDGDTTLGTARSKAFFDADITGDVVCDLTGVTNAENMFYFSSLSSFTATGTEDLINIDGMFGYASNLISFDAPLPKWTGPSSWNSIFNCNLQSFKSNLKSFNPSPGFETTLFGMSESGGSYLNHFEVSEPMSALVDGGSMFQYTHLSTFICPGMPSLQNAAYMFDNCALSYDSLANITNALPTLTSPGSIGLRMGEEVQPADCEWWISQIESKGWNVQISYASESTAATLLSEEEPKTWYTSITVYEENHPAAKYCAWQNADGQIVGLNTYNYVTNPDDYYLASNLADAVAHFGLTQRITEE